jgi:hypothetical protein
VACNFLFAGFSNLDFRTVTTRALRITNLTTDIDTRGQDNQPSLRVYPQLTVADTEFIGDSGLHLYYFTVNRGQRISDCSPADFTLLAYRSTSVGSYNRIGEFELRICPVSAFTDGKVCCSISRIPDGIEEGDVLGILHGESSSLLHEVSSDPQPPTEGLQDIFVTYLNGGNFPLISFSSSEFF